MYLIADVETFGTDPKNGKLLGVALCGTAPGGKSKYVLLQWYDYASSTWNKVDNYEEQIEFLEHLALTHEFIGHNYSYDKAWLDHVLGIDTKWKACTRLMWHLSAAPSGPKPYGLKDAQVELLGYQKKGNTEINQQVVARGGEVGKDIYLADKEVIEEYAKLDAKSTAELFNHLSPFFDKHDYWWMLGKMVKYSWLLHLNTEAGVRVDIDALEKYIVVLEDTVKAYQSKFFELAEPYINRLERFWREDKAAAYVSQDAKERFLSNWELQPKFSVSSPKDVQELFYEVLKLPVIILTDKGKKPSTSVEAIKVSARSFPELKELVEAYEEYQKADAILTGYARPWLGVVAGGRLHPRFNPCGTVSYRLSGFKPYFLNCPFNEHGLMSCFKCDEGNEGVHADFASAEPCVTAHYSQDPWLLKVFKKGLGDVYLDLALTLFPGNKELQEGYNPEAPITEDIKSKFKKWRKLPKIIHLAVQYTGTHFTVKKNAMVMEGIELTTQESKDVVNNYHNHFKRVKVMDEAFFIRFKRNGLLRNVIGRIIRVPTSIPIKKKDGTTWDKPIDRYKDLPNRIIQSSAHDLLTLFAMKIYELCQERGIKAKPILLDCHDSTSWQASKEQIPALEQVFRDALTLVNEEVRMSVDIKIDMKRFTTLAGLKGDDV